MSEEVYAFRKDYSVSTFPVTAKFYCWAETMGRPILQSRGLHSRHSWRQFQQECAEREQAGEWVFHAYYVSDHSV